MTFLTGLAMMQRLALFHKVPRFEAVHADTIQLH